MQKIAPSNHMSTLRATAPPFTYSGTNHSMFTTKTIFIQLSCDRRFNSYEQIHTVDSKC